MADIGEKTYLLDENDVISVKQGGTNASTEDKAFENLSKNFGYAFPRVYTNKNLNELTTSGVYFVSGDKPETNEYNIPTEYYNSINQYFEFNVVVFAIGSRCFQLAMSTYHNNHLLCNIWYRLGVKLDSTMDNISTWYEWKKVANAESFLPLTGGKTLTGSVSLKREFGSDNIISEVVYPYDTKINNERVSSITKAKNGYTQAVLSFNEFGVALLDRTNPESFKAYNLFGEHNLNLLKTNIQKLLNGGNVSMVKSIQRGVISFGSSSTTATATISAVNIAKAIVIHSGSIYGNNNSNGLPGNWDARLDLTSGTVVTATRAYTGGTPTVSYQVVEFY